ncbi:ATM interactor isoform X2 [Aethina tumida]|uniref:ATM interactor isoform X2 n=1 Tax=Aethina tumida TaxID=116153 RepID=UPI00096B6419|nr:ATM interactor isoform X2 [Aethina tumida]
MNERIDKCRLSCEFHKHTTVYHLLARDMALEKIYPKIEELTTFNNKVQCPEENCGKFFSSEANLQLHQVKSHNKTELWSIKKEFHCPEQTCIYHKTKSFKSIKPLKQHYMKTHMQKTIKCTKCQSCFATESMQKSHYEYCGITFNCCDCDAFYACYETLKTHCRRKKHSIKDKKLYKPQVVKTIQVTPRLILPKPMTVKQTQNQSCQTDQPKPQLINRSIQVQNQKISAGTQVPDYIQSSAQSQCTETQTGELFDLPKKHALDSCTEPQNRKSIKVQTVSVPSKTSSCNTSFDLNDFEFTVNTDIETQSSGTQTNSSQVLNYSSSTTTHDSIHTDTSDLLMCSLNDNYDSNFFNCNMETQTDTIFQTDILNFCDLYSNHMYTQTCDDFLNDVVFNDTETQTTIDEMFSSVESQTMMSLTRPIRLEEIHS